MQDIRCQCGKIVCQVREMPFVPSVEVNPKSTNGPAAIILCRHCKRYVVLRVPAIASVSCVAEVGQRELMRA